MTVRLVIIGAGGLARETEWLANNIGGFTTLGFAVSDTSTLGAHDSKEKVLGDINWLTKNRSAFDALAIGIGSPTVRYRLGKELTEQFPEKQFPTLIHPTALFDRQSCVIGQGTIICANVIMTVNVTVEPFVFINLACTVGHETKIGAGSVINPTANISGGVVIEPEVLVGTGAQILQYLNVGTQSKVGAGAVVIRDVPAGKTVVGQLPRYL